ncbi:MAG: hypothetical protein HYU77_14655 [Betaproteobacteria bacterium]|nr:hypothetical protein [Betaproteobacteria bacterium]
MPPRLLADISSHGFGHLSQTAPVLNELQRRIPELRVIVRCKMPREVLARRLDFPFERVEEALDFGMVMDSAVDVRPEDSARAYADAHRDWPARVAAAAGKIAALEPDLVLANIPYLSLAAAARAGVPAVALCSLHWADIFGHYCGNVPGADPIHREILESYRAARCFLRLTPGMAMETLANSRVIGPVARLGAERRGEIRRKLRMGRDERLVVVALGGIPMGLPVDQWPEVPGARFVVPAAWGAWRKDMAAFESLDVHFTDLLASCDVLVTKPGYGSFVEAACNGVRVLYVPRADWPEAPPLVEWLKANAACVEIGRDQLEQGDLAGTIEAVMEMPHPPVPRPTGIEEAAGYLEGVLREAG